MAKRGTLNVGLRIEAGFALLAWIVNRSLGGHARMEDYMPHVVGTADEDETAAPAPKRALDLSTATIEEAFQLMTRMAYATKASEKK